MICSICGGSESYIHCGVEYCKECSVQIKDSREEESSDDSFSRGALLSSPATKKKDKAKKKEIISIPWTMTDAYNLILSKQVSALIKLGCSKELKTVVLHIWARYLQLCEYCFRSDDDDNIPRLSAFAKSRDVEMLYGEKRIGKKQKISYRKHIKAKELLSAQEEKDIKIEECSSVCDSDSIIKSEPDSELSEDITNSESAEDKNSNYSDEGDKVQQKREHVYSSHAAKMKREKKSKKVDAEEACIHHMTLSKTLSFCHLGLLYTEDQLQLFDLVRLANEGKVPYIQITQHFPPSMKLQDKDYNIFTRFSTRERKQISLTSAKLVDFLKLPKFKHPPLLPIVGRFVKDLNLPNDIIPVVKVLIDKYYQPKEVWYTTKKHGSMCSPIPLYEDHAMSFIVIAIKMLFVLDGEFEKEHSEIMMKINTIVEDEKLFVWNEWKKQTSLKEYLFIKDGNTFSNLNRIDSLNVDRIIGNSPVSDLNPEININFLDDTILANQPSENVIKAVLEPLVSIYDLKDPPTSFPLSCQLHHLMTQWEKLPMFKDTKNIDFSFINEDFSSHKLYYWPSSSTSDSEELIDLLQSSLYKSSELVHVQNFESCFEKTLRTTKSYWHGTHTPKTMDRKEKWLEDLPSSFKWLLKFLSKYLQINCSDFYVEIRNIEKKLFKLNS